jgi:hypothetical protein
MDDKSLQEAIEDNSIDLTLDKDTWIYIYGSSDLQQARSLGYECNDRYLQERLKSEYNGFKINYLSAAKKLDFPPKYAIKESLKWNGAYIAKHPIEGEVIAIDRYMDKYQITKKVYKPWHLAYKDWLLNDTFSMTFLSIGTATIILMIFYSILYKISR